MTWTVYAVESSSGKCLWVGMTSRLTRRTWDHRQRFGQSIKIRKLAKYKYPALANKAEYEYIRKLKPKHNQRRDNGGFGRPSYPIDKKHKFGKFVRFSKAELRLLNKAAQKADLPIATFIREATLEKAGQ